MTTCPACGVDLRVTINAHATLSLSPEGSAPTSGTPNMTTLARTEPMSPGNEAPPLPDTMRLVRIAAVELSGKLGIEAVNIKKPRTEAEAQAALAGLKEGILDADAITARKATKGEEDWYAGHKNPAYPQGQPMAPGARRCEYGAKPGEGKRCDRPITVAVWNFSINKHARPLCQPHQPGRRG